MEEEIVVLKESLEKIPPEYEYIFSNNNNNIRKGIKI